MDALRTRLRACRSLLLGPASDLTRLALARGAGGDGVVIDLESTVAPSDKALARKQGLALLERPAEPGFVRLLRINSPRSPEGLRDLLALREGVARPDALVIPKCESDGEVGLVADLLDRQLSGIGLVPMVELARAVFVAQRIAAAHQRVCGLFLGGGDLAADLGADGAWENLLFARSQVVAAAATAGLAAIDVPYFKPDAEGLEVEARASRRLGMTGKAALYPEQLAAINRVFTPSAQAVAKAQAVTAARAAAGSGAPVLGGQVIEPAMFREAERVLAIAAKTARQAAA